ncbi:ATP-binding protein [Corynebacterium lizhenjunii]|uniref:ATP-binding protein n=1 Tax=Corynebacterium lizhenjunii TaxID=2709394 RepID=A0A7T0KG85_9CORY|nr:DUF4143 domain-containing protein [Corynebacterium lizhenjunii]QPK80228.1 ATP-binding protein [Corynebacterium lizhenjunii]
MADGALRSALQRAGATLIEGPKGSGKTEMARQHGSSFIHVDTDPQAGNLMAIDPALLLAGDTPRVLDEWQVFPELWNHVRHEVDSRQAKGQFILTGSTAPGEKAARHSGAGRFSRLTLSTMTFSETGHSTGAVSLRALAHGADLQPMKSDLKIADVVERMCRGGWPGWLDVSTSDAMANARDYLRTVAEVDVATPDGVQRDPAKVIRLLKSLARAVGTEQSVSTLAADTGLGRDTVGDYLDALLRIFISVDQPVWSTHPRSKATLRKAPKRHLVDPALAVAALELNPSGLMNNLEYTGQLFESQIIHELRALSLDSVFHARDSKGREVDAVLSIDGQLLFVEVKLGSSPATLDQAAQSLHAFAAVHAPDLHPVLVVVTAGPLSFTRPDGVHVLSIGHLGA